MKLNKFLWNTYIESLGGQIWIKFFSDLRTHYQEKNPQLKEFIRKWVSEGTLKESYDPDPQIDAVLFCISEVQSAIAEGLSSGKITNPDDAQKLYRDLGDLVTESESGLEEEEEDLFIVDDVPNLSIALFCLFPKYFFPYFFNLNFHALKRIFEEFGIFLPPVPKKSDYDARYYYYLELLKSLQDYWTSLGLDTVQLPVFLYGFAPEVVSLNLPMLEALPEPKRAWFVGGGVSNGDYERLEKSTSETYTFWTGNSDTEAGDIIVMYCIGPRSIVHSIWRAVQPGTVEPFRHYFQTIRMGYPIKVSPIHFSEISKDPILGTMPLVRSKFQGINGKLLPKQYYDRLLQLLDKNGTDVGKLPRLKDREQAKLILRSERDIETKVLEPLLIQLGYKSSDWLRQVKLRVGRSEKVIPDYLLNVIKDSATKTVTADWVWEAKFSISNNEQLARDFSQVCSYARLVGARGVGLVSKEGIWICLRSNDFELKNAKHWSAMQILEVDQLNEITAVVGRNKR